MGVRVWVPFGCGPILPGGAAASVSSPRSHVEAAIGPLLLGQGTGYRIRLKAVLISELRVRRIVLREGKGRVGAQLRITESTLGFVLLGLRATPLPKPSRNNLGSRP